MRRLIFSLILVFLDNYVWLQLQLSFFISTFMIIYVGHTRPWATKFQNRLELFNEWSTLVLCYHLVTFTDFYTNYEFRYDVLGTSFIICVIVIILVNMLVVFSECGRQCRSARIKRSRINRYI